jgi:hypothetical protein
MSNYIPIANCNKDVKYEKMKRIQVVTFSIDDIMLQISLSYQTNYNRLRNLL